jgi:hypothetical protein
MRTITQRIASAFAVLCGQYGDVTTMAQDREQSRQSLYREAEQVARAAAAAEARIDELKRQLAEQRAETHALRERLKHAVEITPEKRRPHPTRQSERETTPPRPLPSAIPLGLERLGRRPPRRRFRGRRPRARSAPVAGPGPRTTLPEIRPALGRSCHGRQGPWTARRTARVGPADGAPPEPEGSPGGRGARRGPRPGASVETAGPPPRPNDRGRS